MSNDPNIHGETITIHLNICGQVNNEIGTVHPTRKICAKQTGFIIIYE